MKLIVFETRGYETLYPLTYLRATFELRCGHTTLEEKIRRAAGSPAETAFFVRKLLEPVIRLRYPGYQVNAFETLNGGLNRDERIYNIFDTDALLNRPPRVAITDKTGIDGFVHWVNEFLGLSGGERLGAIACVKIGRWVDDQYKKHGRMTVISDEELESQVCEHLPEYYARRKK